MRLMIILLMFIFGSAYAADTQRYKAAIVHAAHTAGVDPVTLTIIAEVETNFRNIKSYSTKSTAEGLFQFTDRTWADMIQRYGKPYGYGPRTSKYNYRANALMAAFYLKHNQEQLTRTLKREPTPSELYLAHLLGTRGAKILLSSKTSRRAAYVVSYAYAQNQPIFKTKKGRYRTVGQLRDHMHYRFTKLYNEHESQVLEIANNRRFDIWRYSAFTPIKNWLINEWILLDVSTLTARHVTTQVGG